MKRDVLYVDDESENLVVFEATFDEHFNVTIAGGGEEALAILAERSFPVVVADQRMPKMSGAQLFEIMRHKYPHTRRVMLSGYADSKAMLDAINHGQVFQFLKKPWEQNDVFSVLVRAIESYDMSLSNLTLQDRLVAADRCAMLGRSAAELAHEMGNQLCMLPLLELIEEEYGDHEDLVQMAGFARATHERLVQIINEVKAFVRFEREGLTTQSLRLSEAVHELAEFMRYERSLPLSKLAIEIQAEPVVKANRVKLQQVLLNLLKNAAYAIREREDGNIRLSLCEEGGRAVLRVADNGCGMTAEVAERIWTPFFTTKGNEGTGLGLDVARTIVEAHGGTLTCETAPGQGATFTISLPKFEPTEENPTADEKPAAEERPAARPLVVAPLVGVPLPTQQLI